MGQTWFRGAVDPQTDAFVAVACDDDCKAAWVLPFDDRKPAHRILLPESRYTHVSPRIRNGRLLLEYDHPRAYYELMDGRHLERRLDVVCPAYSIVHHTIPVGHNIKNAGDGSVLLTLPIDRADFPIPTRARSCGVNCVFRTELVVCEHENTWLLHALAGDVWEVDFHGHLRQWTSEPIHRLYCFS